MARKPVSDAAPTESAKKPATKRAAKPAPKAAAAVAEKPARKAAPKPAEKPVKAAAPKAAAPKKAPAKTAAAKPAPAKAAPAKAATPKAAAPKAPAKASATKTAAAKPAAAKKTTAKAAPAKKAPAAKEAPAKAPRARKRPPKLSPDRLELLVAAAKASLEDDKAENVVVLDVSTRSTFTDRMIIATGLADRQIQAMALHVEEALFKNGLKLKKSAFETSDEWVLIDAGDIVIHLFKPEARETFNLEKMWGEDSPASAG
ncbi:ribosome silencing factor [Rhodovarius crocodyli]|uniref:Ribosomal silencing factor RsfS n=1 Tax=Rhodovarius crocodyli TaxID=1979269 RepID=A0A437MPN3_9PROT|nr:ribosome silencing factor [Rhodovarius crocodyli]RVT99599.1 ribosome silencing factor [Rhodovarius crocodyli]